MRYLNRNALAALTTIGLIASAAAGARQKPAGAPAVAPVGDAAPPANLPAGAGPSATSATLAGPARFDEVGYAAVQAGGSGAISAWGAGLPAAGFAEVTDLATGRTVLVKTSDRPVARPGFLVDISPDAAHLLGLSGTGPAQVRVRQVDPIAADQVALDQNRPAAPRLDAPPILLTGLRAQMAQVPTTDLARPAAATRPAPAPGHSGSPAKTGSTVSHGKPGASYPAPGARPSPASAAAKPAPAKTAPKPAAPATGKFRVRVGAFSSEANAKSLAGKLSGHITHSGKYWLVELGPFADAAAAKSARDGAAKRGYGDARVIAN